MSKFAVWLFGILGAVAFFTWFGWWAGTPKDKERLRASWVRVAVDLVEAVLKFSSTALTILSSTAAQKHVAKLFLNG